MDVPSLSIMDVSLKEDITNLIGKTIKRIVCQPTTPQKTEHGLKNLKQNAMEI